MIIMEKRKSCDLLSGQVETLTYYPEENVVRWKSEAKYERLNWDVYIVAFPELKEYYDFDGMTWAGPEMAWNSSDVTQLNNLNRCYNHLRRQPQYKTKKQAIASQTV